MVLVALLITTSLTIQPMVGLSSVPTGVGASAKGEWGESSNGLMGRLIAPEASYPMGAEISLDLELSYDSTASSVHMINCYRGSWSAQLRFEDARFGTVFTRDLVAPRGLGTIPLPRPTDLHELLDQPVVSEDLSVRLLASDGQQIPAGVYNLSVRYKSTGADPRIKFRDGRAWPDVENPDEYWRGQIDTGAVSVEITHVAMQQQVIHINSGLEVWVADTGQLAWSWNEDRPLERTVLRRPGYFLVHQYDLRLFADGKAIECGGGGSDAGAWRNADGVFYLSPELVEQVSGAENVVMKATVELIESTTPAGGGWRRGVADETLWQGEVEGRLETSNRSWNR